MSTDITPPENEQLPIEPEHGGDPVAEPTLPDGRFLKIVLVSGAVSLALWALVEGTSDYLN